MEREIPFMKGYTVFNVEQIEALPSQYYAMAQAPLGARLREAAATAIDQWIAARL